MKIQNVQFGVLLPQETTEKVFYKGTANVIRFDMSIPTGYRGDIAVEIFNEVRILFNEGGRVHFILKRYDDDVRLHFCGMTVVSVGDNLPCLKYDQDVQSIQGDERRMLEDG